MSILKKAFELYRGNFKGILLIGGTLIVPIQVIFTFLTNYLAFPFQYFGVPLWPQIIQVIFMLIAVFVMQPAFVSMVVQDDKFDEVKLGKTYGDAFRYMFPVYVVGIVYALCVAAGFILLFLPGFFLLVWLSAIPCVAVMDDLKWWKGIKRAARFGKENFFKICGVMLFFAFLDALASAAAYTIAYFLTTLVLAIHIALMAVNILLMPLFIFAFSYLYNNWKQKSNITDKTTVADLRRKTV